MKIPLEIKQLCHASTVPEIIFTANQVHGPAAKVLYRFFFLIVRLMGSVLDSFFIVYSELIISSMRFVIFIFVPDRHAQ